MLKFVTLLGSLLGAFLAEDYAVLLPIAISHLSSIFSGISSAKAQGMLFFLSPYYMLMTLSKPKDQEVFEKSESLNMLDRARKGECPSIKGRESCSFTCLFLEES